MGTARIRIVLAEDHAVVRASLRDSLDHFADFEVVGEAADGERALEMVEGLRPDILICDIRIPVLSGIEVASRIRQSSPETRVLVLSAYDDDDYVVELFRAGISGYLLKSIDLNQLVEAIRIIHLGQTVFHPDIAAKFATVFRRSESVSGVSSLSHRELEILQLAAKGLTNRAVADRLGLSTRTVEGHVARVLAKLCLASRSEAVQYFRSL